MPRIPFNTEAEWRALRTKYVGASEVAALFDEHDWRTHFELWHLKAGTIGEDDLSDNERVFWGTVLEPAVAEGVRQKTGWTVRKVRTYWAHDRVRGMGASLDYEIIANEKGPGVLQIKTTDLFAFREWPDGEPPMQYELQVQHEMAVCGRSWGVLAVLVGGNDLRTFVRERHDPTIEKLEAAVTHFWQTIDARREPMPDYGQDLDTIKAIYGSSVAGKVADLSQDNRAPALCAEYRECSTAEKAAKERKDAIKAELLVKIGDAEKVRIGPYSISAGMVRGAHVSYDRKEYRNFRLTERKAS